MIRMVSSIKKKLNKVVFSLKNFFYKVAALGKEIAKTITSAREEHFSNSSPRMSAELKKKLNSKYWREMHAKKKNYKKHRLKLAN
jgi:hypothetical protein